MAEEFDGVTPDMQRAAEKRAAAIKADRAGIDVEPVAAKAKRQTTRES